VRALLLLAVTVTAQQSPDYDYFLSGNAADVKADTKPGVVLAGGCRDVEDAWRWFLAKGGYGDIVVLRASGSNGYHGLVERLGVSVNSIESIVFKNAEASRDPFVIQRIDQADALFFAGGNQANYVRYWKGTPVEEAIHRAAKRGVPIGGTSAGLAILGEFGFSAENGTITSAQAQANPKDPRITLSHDFLRFPHLHCLITDSHFSERKREGRLEVFMRRIEVDYPRCRTARGLGIDERTTVLMDADGTAKVVGSGAAHYWTGPAKHRYAAGESFSLRFGE